MVMSDVWDNTTCYTHRVHNLLIERRDSGGKTYGTKRYVPNPEAPNDNGYPCPMFRPPPFSLNEKRPTKDKPFVVGSLKRSGVPVVKKGHHR